MIGRVPRINGITMSPDNPPRFFVPGRFCAGARILRFCDDVVRELREAAPGICEVHMRSKSRLRRSDLGTNARRIAGFLDRLNRAVVV